MAIEMRQDEINIKEKIIVFFLSFVCPKERKKEKGTLSKEFFVFTPKTIRKNPRRFAPVFGSFSNYSVDKGLNTAIIKFRANL